MIQSNDRIDLDCCHTIGFVSFAKINIYLQKPIVLTPKKVILMNMIPNHIFCLDLLNKGFRRNRKGFLLEFSSIFTYES